jgi:hypothetical protein
MKQRLPAKRTTGWTSNLLAAAGDVLVPLLFAFGVGSIFSLICGCNPFTLYSYIIKKAFFSVGGLLNTLGYTTPIIITGMATALSIRANMYNMGIEGQVFLGAFTAALAGYMIKGVPTALHVTLCLLIGAAFGAVYALIPGLLKAKLRVNEVVTTVMLNSIATQVTGFLTQSYLGTGDAYAHTEFIEQTARLAKLNSKYRCTTAIFIALAIWLILYFILKKTKFGYEIDCIGKQRWPVLRVQQKFSVSTITLSTPSLLTPVSAGTASLCVSWLAVIQSAFCYFPSSSARCATALWRRRPASAFLLTSSTSSRARWCCLWPSSSSAITAKPLLTSSATSSTGLR